MKTRYHFALTVKRQLSDDEKEDLRYGMESEASSVLCDLFGGDSGAVGLKFCDPPEKAS